MPIFVFDPLVLDAVDMSVNQTSALIPIGEIEGCAIHSVFTGSPVGILTVSATNDPTMTPVPVDIYTVTAQGGRMLNIEFARYSYINVTYTATSGTGSLTVRISGKL